MNNEMIMRRFSTLSTTIVSDAMGGHTNVQAPIKPLFTSAQIAGRALTVQLPADDNGAVLQAIRQAKKGDILVIDAKGDTERAVAGDFFVQLAKGVGIQAFVINGVIRDLAAIRELQFPIFALGTTIAGRSQQQGGEVGIPIVLGAVEVHTGDVIVGDLDGVVVVPQQELQTVLQAADEQIAEHLAVELEALQHGEQSIRAYLARLTEQ